MTMRAEVRTVDDLWRAAACCIPALSPEEQRSGILLLRELARGAPVSVAEFAGALGLPGQEAGALVAASRLSPYIQRDGAERIVGFMGLSVVPTRHRLAVSGRTLWTWCAYDTLFLPELLGEAAEVATHDPETGELIYLAVSPSRVEAARPGVVASIVAPQEWDRTSAEGIRASACQYMFFFTSRRSAQRWQARHPTIVLLPLDDAFACGMRANAHRFSAELTRLRAQGG